jgi:hypothetical protein
MARRRRPEWRSGARNETAKGEGVNINVEHLEPRELREFVRALEAAKRPDVAYVKLARTAGGMHIGMLHKNPHCHYLKQRRFDEAPSRAIAVQGELLDVLDWCSKCSPEQRAKSSVEFAVPPTVSGPSVPRAIEGPRRKCLS